EPQQGQAQFLLLGQLHQQQREPDDHRGGDQQYQLLAAAGPGRSRLRSGRGGGGGHGSAHRPAVLSRHLRGRRSWGRPRGRGVLRLRVGVRGRRGVGRGRGGRRRRRGGGLRPLCPLLGQARGQEI